MSQDKQIVKEPFLKVFHNRSELVDEVGNTSVFEEGRLSKNAQDRLLKIRSMLATGFLSQVIADCKKPNTVLGELPNPHRELLESLVNAVTSEVGRALVGLTVLQLCIKTIVPEQSIRLHKGGSSVSDSRFSWKEGLPMRSLDKSFITPVLREYDLLKTNADGVMMTRSLAENYPYTQLYKAAIRGGRDEWLQIVDLLETGEMDPEVALRHLIALLINKSEQFHQSARFTLHKIRALTAVTHHAEQITQFIKQFIDSSDYSARLLEIAMHALFQALEDRHLLPGNLKPLSQMRSANKKHGNIADVEVLVSGSVVEILEAWDAKYGKTYLRDELEELNEKLYDHSETEVVGFVIDRTPELRPEIIQRMNELAEIHGVNVSISSFDQWVSRFLSYAGEEVHELAREWLLAFTESLCQLRRERAPIDEPADVWVRQLGEFAANWSVFDTPPSYE